ncbi:MAG: hypothetical protein M9894_35360 [Planctomycetes bacterium]|nr:hypothetical protein [Planctomycetota bacterium]
MACLADAARPSPDDLVATSSWRSERWWRRRASEAAAAEARDAFRAGVSAEARAAASGPPTLTPGGRRPEAPTRPVASQARRARRRRRALALAQNLPSWPGALDAAGRAHGCAGRGRAERLRVGRPRVPEGDDEVAWWCASSSGPGWLTALVPDDLRGLARH